MKRGFYYINTDVHQRCYYISGEKAGNKWIDIGYDGDTLLYPEWTSLLWTCLLKEFELRDATFHETNPTKFELKS